MITLLKESNSETFSYEEYNKDVSEANRFGSRIEIVAMPWDFKGPHPGFGINWAGIGTVPCDQVYKFISKLNDATEAASKLDEKYKGKIIK